MSSGLFAYEQKWEIDPGNGRCIVVSHVRWPLFVRVVSFDEFDFQRSVVQQRRML